MSVKDTDRGYAALVRRLTTAGEPTVSVGIHEAEGSASEEGGATVAEIGSYHEFGLGVPQRSFIRDWFDENEEANKERIRKLAKAVAEGKIPSAEMALERFGLYAVGSIQSRIADGIEPELAEETIRRKGSSTPLIDTGTLRSSITHKVNT